MWFAFSITIDVAIANFWTTTNQTLQENKAFFFGKIGRKVPQMALVRLDQVSSWTSCFGFGRFD
jgi:hypothetical protein